MRLALVAIWLGVVGGCSPAAALAPDSKKPAHCIAAFNYGAYWFRVGKQPGKVTQMIARGLYEMQKLKASGASEAAAKAEGKALTEAYANNAKVMDSLFEACGTAQDSDPMFNAKLPELMAVAARLQPAYNPQ